jgi:toxin CcdB
MARFDIYPHPDTAMRDVTSFLLDVQNSFIDHLQSRVLVPLRTIAAFGSTMRDLNPLFTISGQSVVLETAALAAFPASALKKPVINLSTQSKDIVAALDTLFGSYSLYFS